MRMLIRLCRVLLKRRRSFNFKNYHTVSKSRNGEFSIPRLDYTVDKGVARSNWMITNLSRDGRMVEARKVFDEMLEPDLNTWTAVISAYLDCGMIGEARKLFDRVDAKRNVVTWTVMITGYIKINMVFEAEKLFDEMPVKNFVSWNTMIDGYIQHGEIDLALGMFNRMPKRDMVSWNTILKGLVQCERIEEAEKFFSQIPEKNVISWTAMVAGLAKYGRVDEARALFDEMPERNIVSWNAMITGYARNQRLDDAFDLFERSPSKDLRSWNAMITGFIQNGDLIRARKMFDEMPLKNVISWTTMITGYVQDDQSEEALKFFLKMQEDVTVKPNQGTFVIVLVACSNLAGLSEGRQIHQLISKTGYESYPFLVSALINMYSKCGDLASASKLFDDGSKSQRDLVSWNGMIAAYAHHGHGNEAIKLFDEMQQLGLKPNGATYVGLLTACSHSGLVDEGIKYLDELVKQTSIVVREDHYTCLVDLCGRAGRLKEAYDFINKLPKKPSSFVWGALLAGCNLHGDSEIGKIVAKKLTEEDPKSSGTYTLLSNIHSSCGNWSEAAKLRWKMRDESMKKQPGCSWIEVGNRVHVFLVGDKSQQHETTNMYSYLLNLHEHMKKIGNVEDDKFLTGSICF